MQGTRFTGTELKGTPMHKALHYVFVTAITLALTSPSFSQDSPSSAVADGQPWTSTTPDGKKMKITFFPDGRSKIKVGLMGMAVTWQPTTDGLCLIGTPQGDKCMRLEKTATGYVGYEGGAATMTLSRR
jgi:hypothetical protein